MTKVPETVEEARARQATIAGGVGALGHEPIVKGEPLPESLKQVLNERRAKRKARDKVNLNWK